jgi:high-affinity iron transporter
MNATTTTLPYLLYSSGILFREGLEALLVIIALVAALRQTGHEARVREIYLGAFVAVACSVLLAWAVRHLFADNTSDTLEGVFQLLAVITLFYVSSWITSKAQAKQWNTFIGLQIESARRSKGPSLALGLTALLAVMREGAETIVFFQALVAGATERAEFHAIIAGMLIGAIALAIAFVSLSKVAFMIPVGPVFRATSVLLYGLAVIFAGQGIASFQESGVIGATFVNFMPTVPMLGLYPTVQTLAAQAILLILALAALVFPLSRKLGMTSDAGEAPAQSADARYDASRAG